MKINEFKSFCSKAQKGSSICRLIKNSKNFELITASRDELDLLSQTNVQKFLKKESPDIVIQAAWGYSRK